MTHPTRAQLLRRQFNLSRELDRIKRDLERREREIEVMRRRAVREQEPAITDDWRP